MPEVFYDMELEDFFLMQKGFSNKLRAEEMRFAKVAFHIAAIHQNGLAGKPIHGDKFWKDWIGEKTKPMTQEQLDERSKSIMERVKITDKILEERERIRKQIKNADKKMN